MPKHTPLEKVAAIREILSVVKRVQEGNPDHDVRDVMLAVKAAVLKAHSNMKAKPFDSLSARQQLRRHNLEVATYYLDDIAAIVFDEETTKALEPDEREALARLKVERSEKRKADADKRKAKDKAKVPAEA